MNQHRVLIDLQFLVDDERFKLAQLSNDATGVSEVSEAGIREVVSGGLLGVDWAKRGLAPVRSVVTTRLLSSGRYAAILVPADSITTS